MVKENKTKVVCTIGPATNNYPVLKKLVEGGMDVARINLCHADFSNRIEIINNITRINQELNTNVAIMCDTKGAKIRTGDFINGEITLKKGDYLQITKKEVLGNSSLISLNMPKVIDSLNEGDKILIDDGLIILKVISKEKDSLNTLVLNSGTIKSKRGVNFPGVKLNIPFLSDDDYCDLEFITLNKVDFISLSFVNNSEDIKTVREYFQQRGKNIKIIAKIETKTALKDLTNIIKEADGVMVARGDLGLEIDMALIPIIQKEIIKKVREQGKMVIVATEMLASMYNQPRPTRAELTDISNAIYDGTDAVMLSGETTFGTHPLEALKYMVDICKVTENYVDFNGKYKNISHDLITDHVTESMVDISQKLKAKLILVISKDGNLPKIISNLKPNANILALCFNHQTARHLALNYGVYTEIVNSSNNDVDIFNKMIFKLKALSKLKKNDIIIVSGSSKEEVTSFLKVIKIK